MISSQLRWQFGGFVLLVHPNTVLNIRILRSFRHRRPRTIFSSNTIVPHLSTKPQLPLLLISSIIQAHLYYRPPPALLRSPISTFTVLSDVRIHIRRSLLQSCNCARFRPVIFNAQSPKPPQRRYFIIVETIAKTMLYMKPSREIISALVEHRN